MGWRWLWVGCVIVSGCAGAQRTRADELLAHGGFEEAAALYAQLLAETPQDRELHQLRDRAQARAVAQLTEEARLARESLAPWAAALERAVALRQGYRRDDTTRLREPLDGEVRAFAGELRGRVGGLAARAPLSAAGLRHGFDRLLSQPELKAAASELDRAIAAGADKACSRLRAVAGKSQPHLTLLVARYCRRFGIDSPESPPPPELRGPLAIDSDLSGVDAAELAWLRGQLDGWFGGTVWHSPNVKRAAVARLRGSLAAQFSTVRITVDAPWTEQVPYSATETYQESYSTTELQSQMVTTYESYTYSCGTSTCTGSRPVSHSEMRSVPVTRYRTATRTVTRYRAEPRLFQYPADRVTGDYDARLRVRIELADSEPPVNVRVDHAVKHSGLHHDVTFPPAGVVPTRPNLPTPNEWLREQAEELRLALQAALDERWRLRFCTAEDFTPEEAARCANGRGKSPPPVIEALRATFGDDAPLLVTF